jgi:hypothetical protein
VRPRKVDRADISPTPQAISCPTQVSLPSPAPTEFTFPAGPPGRTLWIMYSSLTGRIPSFSIGAILAPLVGGVAVAVGVVLQVPAPILAASVAFGLFAAVGYVPHHGSHAPQAEPFSHLERHIAWFRRREEPGELVVLSLPDTADIAGVASSFRITDSVAAIPKNGGAEIVAVVDSAGFERHITAAAGSEVEFGASSFPADAFTLDGLLEHARQELSITRDARRKSASSIASQPRARTLSAELSTSTGEIA